MLETARPRCVRHEVVLGLLGARTLTAPEEVLARVTPVVELASSHGMLQTVVSYGRELMDVIERAAWRVPDEWLHRLRWRWPRRGWPNNSRPASSSSR